MIEHKRLSARTMVYLNSAQEYVAQPSERVPCSSTEGAGVRKCFVAVARERLERGLGGKDVASAVVVSHFRCREAISVGTGEARGSDAGRGTGDGSDWRFL